MERYTLSQKSKPTEVVSYAEYVHNIWQKVKKHEKTQKQAQELCKQREREGREREQKTDVEQANDKRK